MKIKDIPLKVGKEFGYSERQIEKAFALNPLQLAKFGDKELHPDDEEILTRFLRAMFKSDIETVRALRVMLDVILDEKNIKN